MKKLYIFDVDGTLADAYRAIEKSLNFTLRKLGYTLVASLEVAKRSVGRGDKNFMGAFFREKDIEKALDVYRDHHKKALLTGVCARPYARWLLYALKRRKRITAIASNRPHYYTELILNKLKMKQHLDYILCADDINSPKPDPKILHSVLERFNLRAEEAVFVGDMDVDLETAQRAGIDAVFIKGGSSRMSETKKYKNKKIISCLKEIFTLFEKKSETT